MMHFSDRLLNSTVEFLMDDPSGASVAIRAVIVTLYEGKGWTAMAQCIMEDGPEPGKVVTMPLGSLLFTRARAASEGDQGKG